MDIIEKMRLRILEISDPNSSYTQEDFDKEFSNISTTSVNYDVYKIGVKYVNKSTNPDPAYAHEMDSGFDLRANLSEAVTLKSLERKLIPTGLFFQLPNSYELQVRSRSGMALKNGVFVLNSPGTVDNQYTNEVCVILCNLSKDDYIINHGDRIAQGVLSPISSTNIITLISVDSIAGNNGRSNNGFGSTGIK